MGHHKQHCIAADIVADIEQLVVVVVEHRWIGTVVGTLVGIEQLELV